MMKYNSLSSNKIKALPKDLADKIAAGEVVERPLSIVKELVENAIDAGSSSVTVEIKKGGKEYIRVSDNGCGIAKDQLRLAFTRYATSKIALEKDLDNIVSLGFRGEALASIAAVSRIELISKPKDEKIGAKIAYDASIETEFTDAACEDGTTIVVRDLFYNLPARKKFLKPDNTESSLIADFLQKISLAYTDIKFRFINNGTIMFSTLGKGNLYDTILSIYSPQTAKSLVPVDFLENDMHVYGYTSGAEQSKNNKRSQIYFVNGRLIKSKIIDSAIEDAYFDKLFDGRHPICYLFIEVDPSTIDVNVHPSKAEIKIFDEASFKDCIVKSIRRALLAESAAPSIADLKDIKSSFIDKWDDSDDKKLDFSSEFDSAELVNSNKFNATINPISFFDDLREEQQSIEIPSLMVSENLNFDDKPERKFYFSELRAIGQIFSTYIIATDEKSMFIIDQHAAHERVMYERLLSKFNDDDKASQILLTPIVLNLSPADTALYPSWNKMLSEIGFEINEFGPNQFVIKQIPASLDMSEAYDFVNTVIESDAENPEKFQEKRDSIISASCKAAVKAGDLLKFKEINRLFEDLDKCDNPFSCPHGRPTFLRFSESEIEHFFKRK